ncbi:hypothetical protein OROHE_022074 [Orobanche hederae]
MHPNYSRKCEQVLLEVEMMDNEENTWIKLSKFSDGYISGVKAFIKNAVSRFAVDDEILGRS